MPATFLPTTQKTATTSLADLMPPSLSAATPTGRVRTVWVRFCNIGSADATADLYIVDTVVAANANDGYRAKTYPVPYNNVNSAPDFEQRLVLTVGQKIQFKASMASTVAASIEWVEDDA